MLAGHARILIGPYTSNLSDASIPACITYEHNCGLSDYAYIVYPVRAWDGMLSEEKNIW